MAILYSWSLPVCSNQRHTLPALLSSDSARQSSRLLRIEVGSSDRRRPYLGQRITRYGPWKGGEGRHECQASMRSRGGNEDGNQDADVDEEGEMDHNVENDRRDKFAVDEDGLDRFGIPEDAVMDSPIQEPDYHTYVDPVTGEPSPTYGTRNKLPNSAFWGEDLEQIQKSFPAFARGERSGRSSSMIPESREAMEEKDAGPSFRESGMASEARKKAGGRGRPRRNSPSMDEFAQVQSLNEMTLEGEEDRADYNRAMAKENGEQAKKRREDVEEEQEDEEEDLSLGTLLGLNGNRGYPLVSQDAAITDEESGELEKPLSNEEVWWNWKKPAPHEKPWSAWQKRAGDCDTVMAAAMAETGQIKLFGEKPSIAEATLARARRRVFYNERMDAEEARKKKIGSLAYYKEWVKGYKNDTSKKAVARHYQETGEEEGIQLLDMFAHQTAEEYRVMQGTDVRIRRDPLTMRMRPDQIKRVWGGDPVYPTINYEQDPDEVVDYRNENMHEPIPDIIEILRENGRLLTEEEVKAMLEEESIEENELTDVHGISAVRDIEDDDEDEIEVKEDDDIDFDGRTTPLKSGAASKTPTPSKQINFGLDEIKIGDADEEVEEEVEEETDGRIIDEDDAT